MPKNLLFEAKPGLLVHEWTRQTRAAVPEAPAAVGEPGAWARAVAAAAPALGLEQPVVPGRSALETLARRRSVRQYAATPLALAELGGLLALSTPAPGPGPSPHTRLQPWRHQRPDCAVFVLALRVDGLTPGGYLYDAAAHQLLPVRLEHPLPLLQAACFQREFCDAAALLLVAGSLAEQQARHGERGYRALLLDAGVMLQRIYFAVSALGLVGSATGSLVQDQLSAWLGLDGYNGAVLMGFALGHSAGGAPA